MRLFNFHSRYEDDLAIAPGAKDGKIYKLVQLIAISVILAAATLLIFEVSQLLKIGSTANGMIFSVGVIGLGGFFALPWVRVFESVEEKPFKITGIVFLALIGVCVILWIVCVWQIIGLVKNIGSDEVIDKLVRSLNVIRASIIVSIQIVIASNIVMNVIKYRKTLLPYQILSGVSKLYIDFYITLVFTAVTITTDGLKLSSTATILTNKWLLPLLVVFIMFTIFPSAVFKRADRRRLLAAKKEDMKEIFTNNQPQASNTNASNNLDGDSVEKKLQKIKTLLDNGLITQEEYDAKRAEILSNI
ncbi:MAG: SHOCT domain-containing protein [Anaeroplasmataceae bacterium]|nr:SHOCT domain-containing protein [Anaeroplasmataceae bacterium]MDE7100892.1 SHOCT domain-containing protein [Anaeroplasmataceae bacterium]